MQIDCRNLECPKPVIKTKETLKSLKIGQNLEILVNSKTSLENISRFLNTNSMKFEVSELDGGEFCIKTTKMDELEDENIDFAVCDSGVKNVKKVIFLNEESCGSGEVGKSLLAKFLGTIKNLTNPPKTIICVNNAVFMTTNRAHACYPVLKDLESIGIEILSCGSCLEAYKLVDKLSIGKMSNAYEIMEILTQNEVLKL
ncbi:sulfurtransferase-like selenium metabolism protein YedF [Campylobacter hominis]|uniref:UPF0033 domain-containing protein n=1 Tax=Campylobacter hominis (strain ATCC BAA-381 / DSM 21671 / CCUG 45161 / LMG 19568 / NCTC 13146 / CH001A) TaxID=360107 RepID=A7I448_CAMHC|nr:sulfurtransferase-like selenium metabolism protein YedF [Campylobacter hominis]ABS51035.1 conserved hypothetical protein [Campylobacter hominis ATCC BAA-381]UAK85523.1 sulfurtransferase-like selenium metabolism protein YedF [Campylobacter hominis]SUW85793.1 translation initiation factor IF-3 [Campylobacter hominis]